MDRASLRRWDIRVLLCEKKQQIQGLRREIQALRLAIPPSIEDQSAATDAVYPLCICRAGHGMTDLENNYCSSAYA